MLLILRQKLFWLLIYLNFSPDFFGDVGKRLDKKAKVNFKNCDVADWETNNYKTHLVLYNWK